MPNTDMHHNTSIGFGNLGAAATAPTFLSQLSNFLIRFVKVKWKLSRLIWRVRNPLLTGVNDPKEMTRDDDDFGGFFRCEF